MSDLYHEIILDHAAHPHNQGVLEVATHTLQQSNASCGDTLKLQLKIVDGKVVEVAWQGNGCAISTASTSMFTEMIKGKSVQEVKAITQEKMMEEMGMDEILPTREKCLMLPLRAVKEL